MSQYISELQVSVSKEDEEQLRQNNFQKLDFDVTRGSGENKTFIWFKTGTEGITRIQLSYSEDMQHGLRAAGYTKIEKNLNPESSGDPINLWYYKGSLPSDVPIVELAVIAEQYDEGPKFSAGWERMACDLNEETMDPCGFSSSSGKPSVYLWMRREIQTFICDVTASDDFTKDASFFEGGFTRLDKNTNRGAEGALVYVWYRVTKDPREAITEVRVSEDEDDHEMCVENGYQRVELALDKRSRAGLRYLWFKKEYNDPIQVLSLIQTLWVPMPRPVIRGALPLRLNSEDGEFKGAIVAPPPIKKGSGAPPLHLNISYPTVDSP